MMNKKASFVRKFGGAGLAGALVFGASAAMAADFDVSAEVQNALTVTNVADLNLGTIFATTASTGTVSILRFLPGGSADPVGSGAGPLLALGGYVPAQAAIEVGATTTFTVTLPEFVVAGTGTNGALVPADTALLTGLDDESAVELVIQGGNPGVAKLYLVNFRAGNATNVATTGGFNCVTLTVAAADGNTCDVTPAFFASGTQTVGFNIGADLVTEATALPYEAGIYEGTFEVTATY